MQILVRMGRQSQLPQHMGLSIKSRKERMKTRKEWKGSFQEYIEPGDEVDAELYWYFLEILPPIYPLWDTNKSLFQVSEPYDHEYGKPRYSTFYMKNGRYFYAGLMDTDEAKQVV